MSTASDLAGLADLAGNNRTRYAEVDVAGIRGKVRLRSLSGSHYARVQGLKSQAMYKLANDKPRDAQRFTEEAEATMVQLMWVDASGNPVASSPSQLGFRDIDVAVKEALVAACETHLGETVSEEDAAKN